MRFTGRVLMAGKEGYLLGLHASLAQPGCEWRAVCGVCTCLACRSGALTPFQCGNLPSSDKRAKRVDARSNLD
jgi:hypothetical protein